jgi:uncharacterized membrane protein
MKKAIWISSIIIVLEIIAGLILLSYLPDSIPSHWNAAGAIDAYSSKYTIFMAPGVSLFSTALLLLIPLIDPKRESFTKDKNYSFVMSMFAIAFNVFFAVIFSATVCAALGRKIDINIIIPIAVGLLLAMLGVILPKISPNYMMGIKLPWTLASEENWRKTHKLGGIVFIIIGVAFIICSALKDPLNFAIPITLLFGGIIYLTVYSYVEFKQESKKIN